MSCLSYTMSYLNYNASEISCLTVFCLEYYVSQMSILNYYNVIGAVPCLGYNVSDMSCLNYSLSEMLCLNYILSEMLCLNNSFSEMSCPNYSVS
jgi:hypothetical protein